MNIDQKTLKQIKPWIILILFCAFLVLILINSNSITSFLSKFLVLCSPFFYAIVFAYILNIPMVKFECLLKKHLKQDTFLYKRIRGISISLTVILTLTLISVLLSIIVPQLINNVVLLSNNLVNYIISITNTINQLFIQLNLEESLINVNPDIINQYIDSISSNWEAILQSATTWVSDAGELILKNAVSFTILFGNIFMGFMMSLYLLSSKEILLVQFRKIVAAIFPYKVAKALFDIAERANDIFGNYISGQLLENVILGSLIYIGMIVFNLGNGYEVLIAVIVAIASIIPIVGAVFAMIFGFLLILATDPLEAILFVIFYQIVQQLETNLIYPNVVGKSVGLPAIWTLLSIVIFGGLFGFFGMLVAVPTTALIYTLLSELVHWRLKEKQCTVTQTEIISEEHK